MENTFCTCLLLFLGTDKVMTASDNSGAENTIILRNKREAAYCKDRYKPDHSMCLPKQESDRWTDRLNLINPKIPKIPSEFRDQREIVRVYIMYRSNGEVDAGIDYKDKDAVSHKDTGKGNKSTAILPAAIVLLVLVSLVTR